MQRIKYSWKTLGVWIAANKVRFFLIAGIMAVSVVLVLDYLFLEISNGKDVLVEAHGMLFDIILFGIILTVYEAATEKQRLIKSYKDQLKSFREWYDNEVAFRVRYVVNELDKLGIKDMDLSYLHLGKVGKEKIENQIKRGTHIASLKGAFLANADLQGAVLSKSDIQGADLFKANLGGAKLKHTNLQEADLWSANLSEADLSGANLQGTNLLGADLSKARAHENDIELFGKVMNKDQMDSILWVDSWGNSIDPEIVSKKLAKLFIENEPQILIGPRGGKYYLNSKNKKVYRKNNKKA